MGKAGRRAVHPSDTGAEARKGAEACAGHTSCQRVGEQDAERRAGDERCRHALGGKVVDRLAGLVLQISHRHARHVLALKDRIGQHLLLRLELALLIARDHGRRLGRSLG
jgi:hypothetical protein